MNAQNITLNIGDEIGFVNLAQNIDENDKTVFFPVVEITRRDGERAYRYMYPDGEISRSAVKGSQLANYSLRINKPAVEAAPVSKMISLTERKSEFLEAMKRGQENRLEVFNGWDRDTFHVKNHDSEKEYKVVLKTTGGETSACCDCADFKFRRRLCKHISAVLSNAVFGLMARN